MTTTTATATKKTATKKTVTKKPLTLGKPVLVEGRLYYGDNGRIFCSNHAGMSALYDGRDLSGQKVKTLGPSDYAAFAAEGMVAECEDCAYAKKG